ncbi:hypothetical protein Cgig2_012200 [Carnegiea gigantea]|uniref:Uncharacterized protein n=1 Tax=Carnegiea gigantea TaxID=171969 RepID=A0A9Q1KPS9_9CARY|nr:hypothetical protein Cgig2_012200 [Carnegiea gigantea]
MLLKHCRKMRGRSYSYSPSPPRGYGRRYRSPSPRGRYSCGKDAPTSLLVRNLRHDCRGRSYDRRRSPLRYSRSPRYRRSYSRSPDYSPRRYHSRSISPRDRSRSYRDPSYSRSPYRSPYGSRSRSRSPYGSRSRSRSRSVTPGYSSYVDVVAEQAESVAESPVNFQNTYAL